jgi:hypothetical protein
MFVDMKNLRASMVLMLLVVVASVAATVAGAVDDGIATVYAELSLPLPTTKGLVVCHGFGCNFRTQVNLVSGDRAKLAALLAPGRRSPEAERKALAAATAWFDRRIGPAAGTTRRVAFARARSGDPEQMDCIDLSSNNTSLFVVLEQLHLLAHHRVEHPVSRGILIDGRLPHTTAVLREIRTDRRWAIDNWTHKFGEPPDVEPLEQWLREG